MTEQPNLIVDKESILKILGELLQNEEEQPDVNKRRKIDPDKEQEKVDKICIIWDMSASKEISQYLFDECHVLDVMTTLLENENAHTYRFFEVVVGTLANICSTSAQICELMATDKKFVPILLEHIGYSLSPYEDEEKEEPVITQDDQQSETNVLDKQFVTQQEGIYVLSEIMRFLSAATSYDHKCTRMWLKIIREHEIDQDNQLLNFLLFTLDNCLNSELLERTSTLLLNITFFDTHASKLLIEEYGAIPYYVRCLKESLGGDNENVADCMFRILETLSSRFQDDEMLILFDRVSIESEDSTTEEFTILDVIESVFRRAQEVSENIMDSCIIVTHDLLVGGKQINNVMIDEWVQSLLKKDDVVVSFLVQRVLQTMNDRDLNVNFASGLLHIFTVFCESAKDSTNSSSIKYIKDKKKDLEGAMDACLDLEGEDPDGVQLKVTAQKIFKLLN
ncbi:hypothetical protein AKO1_012366 [Acrasis kona]|uniref:Protein saal1 n=1 Tax=Acrasis kona TaxID=1008807 RepID=A0AAW2YXM2_9EUKA